MRGALALGLALSLGCAAAQRPARPRGPATAAEFFPLRRGAAWSFDTDTHIGGDTTLSVLSVAEARPPEFSVRSGRRVERYELRPDGVVREGEYLLRDPIRQGATWEGRGGSRYEVVAVHPRRAVGEQSFTEVIEVRKSTPGTRIETTTFYARDVGPIEVVASTTSSLGGAINVRSTLRGYSLGDEAPRSE